MVIDMRDKSIGRTLRYYRKAAQLSIADVIEIFQTEYDIHYTNKAIYGWESGHTQPSADTFLTLCKIYDIHNIIESMNYACKTDKGIRHAFSCLPLCFQRRSYAHNIPAGGKGTQRASALQEGIPHGAGFQILLHFPFLM